MVQTPPHSQDVLPIVQLVREKVADSGLSLRAFAQQRRIPYSTVRYYNDKRLAPLSQPPRKETLRELALALDVPLGEVEQAALESLSYRAAPAKLEPGTTTADDHDRPLLLDVVEAIRADPHLLPEAKEHLERQYGLLLRVQAEGVREAREEHAAREAQVSRLKSRDKGEAVKPIKRAPRKTPTKRRT